MKTLHLFRNILIVTGIVTIIISLFAIIAGFTEAWAILALVAFTCVGVADILDIHAISDKTEKLGDE